jgi:hypothetical protein
MYGTIKEGIRLAKWANKKPSEALILVLMIISGLSVWWGYRESNRAQYQSDRADHFAALVDSCRLESDAREDVTRDYIMSLVKQTLETNRRADSSSMEAHKAITTTKKTITEVKKKL